MFFHYHKVAREYRKVCELFRLPPITYLFKSLRFPPGLIYAKEVSSAIMKKKESIYWPSLSFEKRLINREATTGDGDGEEISWNGGIIILLTRPVN